MGGSRSAFTLHLLAQALRTANRSPGLKISGKSPCRFRFSLCPPLFENQHTVPIDTFCAKARLGNWTRTETTSKCWHSAVSYSVSWNNYLKEYCRSFKVNRQGFTTSVTSNFRHGRAVYAKQEAQLHFRYCRLGTGDVGRGKQSIIDW